MKQENPLDYERVWTDFWKEICTHPNGRPNHDAIKRELYDYWCLLQNVPVVYDRITGGLISKPNTKAEAVIAVYEDVVREDIDRAVEEANREKQQ